MIRDFGARGHWGNRLARFSKKVGAFDPKGIFANRKAKIIGIKYPQFSYPASW
ncbi:MAG: hypothetical protein ACI86X_002330 [Moritella sp.]